MASKGILRELALLAAFLAMQWGIVFLVAGGLPFK
jgi:hypothetical protein